jgi:hypothetical protein
MRDDGASFDLWPLNDNLSTEINRFNTDGSYIHLLTDTSAVFASAAFSEPAGTNTTLDVFHVTSRIFSNNVFRCLDAVTAYANFHNTIFKPEVYYFEFNRSYQSASCDPNGGVCQAPVTASHPYGEPDLEYFKCHSGDFNYVLGTLQHTGLPLRDDNDLQFE